MRVALAYSGGLDTSVAARWLVEKREAEVIAVVVDVGQHLDVAALEARTAAAGVDLVVVDASAEFVTEYCWPALQANALYEGKYPLVSALARPVIAAKVVETARALGATAVAHGCTGKGNDQVRFETTFAALAPDLAVLAPVRDAAMSRNEALARAREWGIEIAAEAKKYSVDENLWGRTIECGPVEDAWAEPPADAFGLTADPVRAPDEPEDVVVAFDGGVPIAVDGEALGPLDLVARVAVRAGRHGFGRVDMIENRLVGIKSREVYEVPAALALIAAHRDLEDLTLERDLAHEKAGLERRWAELAYYGQWHGPLHAALRAFVAESQADVSGEVRLRLHKGSCRVLGRRSPRALYDRSLATYEAAGDRFDHRHAEGFVRLWSLPIRTWAARDRAGASDARAAEPVPEWAGEEVGAAPSAPAPSATPASAPAPSAPAPASRDAAPGADVSSPNGGVARPAAPGEALWSGRFSGGPSPEAHAFTRSLAFDVRLAPYDVRATVAHVGSLLRAGLVEADEAERITAELDRIGAEIAAGTFAWVESDEDVHSGIERALIERLGPTGAKVHAGRSRNDLVATDLRLWAKEAATGLTRRAVELAETLAGAAATAGPAILPGYTHLQRAQPVLLAHHLLAHAFPLARDADRLLRARDAADVSSLGAGALAGTTLPIDPAATAAALGFARAFDNSMDAVADRDFALDLLAACATTAVHVSRLAEDVVLWSTDEFGFARPSEADATGSSMMPQKRNPDVAELARAKVGRILGDLVALATAMKGLPLAYNRDLQEDKEAVFDAHDALAGALDAMTGMVRRLRFDPERMRRAVPDFALATDVAEHLVARGMPFREAHRLVGSLVAHAERTGRTLRELPVEEWRRWSPVFDGAAPELLDPERAVERRMAAGATSAASVEGQMNALRERLSALRARAAAAGRRGPVAR